jgi:uncharacterized protein YbaA (DUF1428 family)
MSYVDGFVLPVPKKSIAAYRRIATTAGKIWREHGALEYRECVVEDLNVKFGVPFSVNARVMKDPRLVMDPAAMPVDIKRMVYGGFDVLVDV